MAAQAGCLGLGFGLGLRFGLGLGFRLGLCFGRHLFLPVNLLLLDVEGDAVVALRTLPLQV